MLFSSWWRVIRMQPLVINSRNSKNSSRQTDCKPEETLPDICDTRCWHGGRRCRTLAGQRWAAPVPAHWILRWGAWVWCCRNHQGMTAAVSVLLQSSSSDRPASRIPSCSPRSHASFDHLASSLELLSRQTPESANTMMSLLHSAILRIRRKLLYYTHLMAKTTRVKLILECYTTLVFTAERDDGSDNWHSEMCKLFASSSSQITTSMYTNIVFTGGCLSSHLISSVKAAKA